MNANEKLIELAKMDGYTTNGPSNNPRAPQGWCWRKDGHNKWFDELQYLTSYDAIIPIAVRILGSVMITADSTPAKIADMVLTKSGAMQL